MGTLVFISSTPAATLHVKRRRRKSNHGELVAGCRNVSCFLDLFFVNIMIKKKNFKSERKKNEVDEGEMRSAIWTAC